MGRIRRTSKISAIKFSHSQRDKIIKSSDVDAIENFRPNSRNFKESEHEAAIHTSQKEITDAEKIEQLTQIGFSESSARELLQPDFW